MHQADRHNILFLASALTFDALLAAIPLLLLLLVALTHVAHLSPRSSAQDLHQLFQRVVPPAASARQSPRLSVLWLAALCQRRKRPKRASVLLTRRPRRSAAW